MQLQVSHNLTIWTSQKSEFRSSKSDLFFYLAIWTFSNNFDSFFLQLRVCLAVENILRFIFSEKDAITYLLMLF